MATPRDDQAVPPTFASWDEYWAVRHDARLWEPFFVRALRSADLSSSTIVMLRPSQYPTARAGEAIVTIYPGTLISGWSCAMELEAHSLVARCGLPIPGLIAHGVFPQRDGQSSWSWLVESAATGVPWSRGVAALSEEQRRRAAADVGATLRRLHETPHEAATVLAPDWRRFSDIVVDELSHLGTNDARLDAFPKSFQPALRDLASQTLDALDTPVPTKLLHGDVHGDNVFVDPSSGEITGLIDLNEMYAGHPWYDLADASFRLLNGAPGLTASLLHGYGLDPSTHDRAAVQLLGWALLHDFDGLTATIQRRGLPAGDTIEELAAHLTGLDLQPRSTVNAPPASPSPDPMFVLLTGPAGSGKSTAAAAWASQGTAPRALLDVDQLRALTKAGFAHPEHGWTDETERQWTIGTDLCAAMARVYKTNGVSVIIDVYAPPWPGDPWSTLIDELDGTVVTLLPSIEICLARNTTRARDPFLADADLRANYDDFAECVALHPPEHLIDTSTLTVDQVVQRIQIILDERASAT